MRYSGLFSPPDSAVNETTGKRIHVHALKFGTRAAYQSNQRQGIRQAPSSIAVIVDKSHQEELVAIAIHFRFDRPHRQRRTRTLFVHEDGHGAPRTLQNPLLHRFHTAGRSTAAESTVFAPKGGSRRMEIWKGDAFGAVGVNSDT